jgi:hypothetical protein
MACQVFWTFVLGCEIVIGRVIFLPSPITSILINTSKTDRCVGRSFLDFDRIGSTMLAVFAFDIHGL